MYCHGEYKFPRDIGPWQDGGALVSFNVPDGHRIKARPVLRIPTEEQREWHREVRKAIRKAKNKL